MQKKKLFIALIVACVVVDAAVWWHFFAPNSSSVDTTSQPAETTNEPVLVPDEPAPIHSDEVVISTSQTAGEAPLSVSLAVASTLFRPEEVTAVTWDFNDEYALADEGENSLQVTHEFLFPGLYPVSVIITDSAGNSYISSVLIQVVGPDETPNDQLEIQA